MSDAQLLLPSVKDAEPKWMAIARAEMGVKEVAGYRDNPTIIRYFRDVGQRWPQHDETSWCAAFVGSCLERAGITSTRSLLALSYREWARKLDTPRPGCVAVFWRGSPSSGQGHVGFYVKETENYVYLLGGNQNDTVSIAPTSKARLLGYRWPIIPDPVPAPEDDSLFYHFADLMLDLEGGWTDGTNDPGGPTNKGITLTDWAAYKGQRITGDTYDDLVESLRDISDEDAMAIYWKDYWTQVDADHLPDGLAAFTFDTAVLQGVGIAKRLLQAAVGADVDGIIGPKTRGAAVAANEVQALTKFRNARLARLRKSANWTRYGDGWTNRISAMFDEALEHAKKSPETITANQTIGKVEGRVAVAPKQIAKGVHLVAEIDLTNAKPWTGSLTIWGAIVTFLATVVPAIGQLVGVDISADLVQTFGQAVGHLIEAVGGVMGTVMVIWGRFRAQQPVATATQIAASK